MPVIQMRAIVCIDLYTSAQRVASAYGQSPFSRITPSFLWHYFLHRASYHLPFEREWIRALALIQSKEVEFDFPLHTVASQGLPKALYAEANVPFFSHYLRH